MSEILMALVILLILAVVTSSPTPQVGHNKPPKTPRPKTRPTPHPRGSK